MGIFMQSCVICLSGASEFPTRDTVMTLNIAVGCSTCRSMQLKKISLGSSLPRAWSAELLKLYGGYWVQLLSFFVVLWTKGGNFIFNINSMKATFNLFFITDEFRKQNAPQNYVIYLFLLYLHTFWIPYLINCACQVFLMDACLPLKLSFCCIFNGRKSRGNI